VVLGARAVTVTATHETGVHAAAGPGGGPPGEPIEDALRRGDYRLALALCARSFGAPLGRLCLAMTGSQAEAEELVQETLLAAYDAFPQYRGEGSIKAFLYAIARRTCARSIERRARRDARVRLVTDGEVESGDASDLAARRQLAQRTRSALDALRPSEREALLLRYQAELPFRDVALACGCDEAAARKRVSRALERLRDLLAEEP
jgi:RNA polymerase sigma-70 factor (ECF subfamily)